MSIEIPKRYTVSEKDSKNYVLKNFVNIYGARQAPRQWYQYLCKKLDANWEKSIFNTNIFFHKFFLIIVYYVDNTIILGSTIKDIENVFKKIQTTNLELTMERDLADFLGGYIETLPDNKSFHFYQKYQIQKVLKDLNLHADSTKSKSIFC